MDWKSVGRWSRVVRFKGGYGGLNMKIQCHLRHSQSFLKLNDRQLVIVPLGLKLEFEKTVKEWPIVWQIGDGFVLSSNAIYFYVLNN